MADVINNSQYGINRVGRVQISRDKAVDGSWLIKVPQHVFTALNKSTGLTYGTSFDHNKSVTLWLVGNGTYAGVAGTAVGIFIGTGVVG